MLLDHQEVTLWLRTGLILATAVCLYIPVLLAAVRKRRCSAVAFAIGVPGSGLAVALGWLLGLALQFSHVDSVLISAVEAVVAGPHARWMYRYLNWLLEGVGTFGVLMPDQVLRADSHLSSLLVFLGPVNATAIVTIHVSIGALIAGTLRRNQAPPN